MKYLGGFQPNGIGVIGLLLGVPALIGATYFCVANTHTTAYIDPSRPYTEVQIECGHPWATARIPTVPNLDIYDEPAAASACDKRQAAGRRQVYELAAFGIIACTPFTVSYVRHRRRQENAEAPNAD